MDAASANRDCAWTQRPCGALGKNALALAHQVGERAHLFLTDDEHSTQAFGLYETPLFRQLLEKGK